MPLGSLVPSNVLELARGIKEQGRRFYERGHWVRERIIFAHRKVGKIGFENAFSGEMRRCVKCTFKVNVLTIKTFNEPYRPMASTFE